MNNGKSITWKVKERERERKVFRQGDRKRERERGNRGGGNAVADFTQFLLNKKWLLRDPYFEWNRRSRGQSLSSTPLRPSSALLQSFASLLSPSPSLPLSLFLYPVLPLSRPLCCAGSGLAQNSTGVYQTVPPRNWYKSIPTQQSLGNTHSPLKLKLKKWI